MDRFMDAARSRRQMGAQLMAESSAAYTAGAQRGVIDLAAWLLHDFRTEGELCENLGPVFDEIEPLRRKALLERELAKLKTPSARAYLKKAKPRRRS